ncbi:MAG: hypothetical protein LBJ67_08530 [Planctomycetaceae bacterium]|jgi:hypothetical protein|nr:hypothetical protein [Planctomycetaceae bacterium]
MTCKQTMFVTFTLVVIPVLSAFAGPGICTPNPTAPGGTSSTIACVGQMQIDSALNYCKDDPESECTETPAYIFATIQGKLQEGSWGSFAACMGGNVACAACVVASALVCWTPPWLQCALVTGGCSLVCTGATTADSCCWSTCVLDMTTLHKTGGGTTC